MPFPFPELHKNTFDKNVWIINDNPNLILSQWNFNHWDSLQWLHLSMSIHPSPDCAASEIWEGARGWDGGLVVRVTVSMIRDLLHLSIVAALPSLVTHNGWSHRHTSHVTPWHRDTGHWGSGLGLTSGHTQSPDQTCAAADVTPEHGSIVVMILSHCFLIIFCLIFLIFPIVTCTAHDVMLMSHKSSKLLYFSSVTKVGSRHK